MSGKMSWIGCLMLLVGVGAAQGAGMPVVELEEGDNRIVLSIVNQGEEALKGLWVEVKAEGLPSWVRIGKVVQRVDVPKQSTAREKLRLNLHVGEGVKGESFELPLVLRDAVGHTWAFRVLAKVNASHPRSYALMQNVPNPFNSSTVIRYAVGGNAPVRTRLEVFNSVGQRVRTLVDAEQGAGFYSVVWDGRDDDGRFLSSGVYFYRLTAGEFVQVRKMALVE